MSIVHCPACGNAIEVHFAGGLRSGNPLLNDPEWLRRKYWNERLTLSEVAKAAGLSASSAGIVARALRKYGIEVRNQRPSSRPAALAERT